MDMDCWTNCFRVNVCKHWSIFEYTVKVVTDDGLERRPGPENVRKEHLLNVLEGLFEGAYVLHDREIVWSSRQLDNNIQRPLENGNQLLVTLTGPVAPSSSASYLAMRKISEKCISTADGGLVIINHSFFKPTDAKRVQEDQFEVWGGFSAEFSMRQAGLLLTVDHTSALLSSGSVLTMIRSEEARGKTGPGLISIIDSTMEGTNVVTLHDRRVFRIIEVSRSKTGLSPRGDSGLSYAEFARDRLHLGDIQQDQPLLKVVGVDGASSYILPQTARAIAFMPTGFDGMLRRGEMRGETYDLLDPRPEERTRFIAQRMDTVILSEQVATQFARWGIGLERDPITVQKPLVLPLTLGFAGGALCPVEESGDFSDTLRERGLLQPVRLQKWAIIMPQIEYARDQGASVVKETRRAARRLRMANFHPPTVLPVDNVDGDTYVRRIRELDWNGLQFILVMTPTRNRFRVRKITRVLVNEVQIPFAVAEVNISRREDRRSNIEGLLVAMNFKLGGRGWGLPGPILGGNSTVVGIRIRDSKPECWANAQNAGEHSGSVALVSSTDKALCSFRSMLSSFSGPDVLTTEITRFIRESVEGRPDTIVIFHEILHDAELGLLIDQLLPATKAVITEAYTGDKAPRLIVLSAAQEQLVKVFPKDEYGEYVDLPSGSVLVDTVTKTGTSFTIILGYDKTGSRKPTSFTLLHDSLPKGDIDELITMTFALCHMHQASSSVTRFPMVSTLADQLVEFGVEMRLSGIPQSLARTPFFI